MRHSKLILIFLLGALYFSLSLLFPHSTQAYIIDGSYAPCDTCTDPNPGYCSISEPGSCNACPASPSNSDCCGTGSPWTRYRAECKLTNPLMGTCGYAWVKDADVCSTGDKYNSSNQPVMNAGNCDCTVGGGYKTCCSGTTQVNANHYQLDPYPPDEADCGGYSIITCGDGGQPACGQAACDTLAPGPTLTPTPTPAPTPPAQPCTPFSQGPICDTNWCSDGSVCAQGHYYCLWDGSGYGQCSEEVNNCATQCTSGATPPPPPPGGGCSFGSCGGSGCASDQRYVQGDCYSYSWYSGAGCYADTSCVSGGGSSSVSCAATSPVMLGDAATISITQSPNLGDNSACYYNSITASIYQGGVSKGSCTATGFTPTTPTRSCNYTPSSIGGYTANVYYGGHTDEGYWSCAPPDYTSCTWIDGCADPQAWGNCIFSVNYPPPPAPAISTSLSCIPKDYNGTEFTISWTDVTPAITYVQISTSDTFSTVFYKQVSGTSTTAPSGFSNNLTFNPGTTYYVRLWNGIEAGDDTAFTTPPRCILPCPGGLSACGDSIPSPNSIGTCNGSWSPNPGPDFAYNAWCEVTANPDRGYCYQCGFTPWFQATGDVHSNEGIIAPEGP